jgi:hypothetical protein
LICSVDCLHECMQHIADCCMFCKEIPISLATRQVRIWTSVGLIPCVWFELCHIMGVAQVVHNAVSYRAFQKL